MRIGKLAAFTWFVGFAFAYLYATGKAPLGYESSAFAQSLLDTGTYAWRDSAPWAMPGGALTAHKGPFLTWVLALVSMRVPAVVLLNAAAEALTLAALLALVPPGARRWVGAVFALSPFVLMNIPVIGDMAFTHALLAWGFYYALRPHRAGVAGVLFGLAALSLPVSMVLAAIVAVRIACDQKQRAAVFVAAVALTVAPWTVRNAVAFHRFIPVASNLPLEIYYGNNPEANGGMYTDACSAITRIDDAHKRALAGLDEATGYARMGDEAYAWMGAHPQQALLLRVRAFMYFWHPQAFWLKHCAAYAGARWRVLAAVNIVYLAGAFVGLAHLARNANRRMTWTVLAALASVTAVYTATHADIGWRYRAPIEPILCVLCALGLRQFWRMSANARRTRASCSAK